MTLNPKLTRSRPPARWAGFAAAVWGFVFAAPSLYWALGGLAGASSVVAPSLVQLARERNPGFLAVLWITGALKLVGGALGLALVRRRAWGRGMNRALQLTAWGAAVLLVWHGALFVGQGLLVQAHVIRIPPDLLPISRWYTFLWGPWFVAGGVLFAFAARFHRDGVGDRRDVRGAGLIGGLGALLVSVALLVMGIG